MKNWRASSLGEHCAGQAQAMKFLEKGKNEWTRTM